MSEPTLGWDELSTGTIKSKYTLAKRESMYRMLEEKDDEIAKLTKTLNDIIEGYPNIEGLMVPWSRDSIIQLAKDALNGI